MIINTLKYPYKYYQIFNIIKYLILSDIQYKSKYKYNFLCFIAFLMVKIEFSINFVL